jgi:glutathione S-transferase/GST-like protein
MIHNGRIVPESTAMMEYIDEAFEGPPLRPADPFERWRMRWWCRFFDQFFGPSVSQFGWSYFVGPAVQGRDPEALEAAIKRIPMPERQTAWRKAIYGQFSEEELAESRRRILLGVQCLEDTLSERPWLAGAIYSIADMIGFNMVAALPAMMPDIAGDATTPRIMEWLRRMNERPAVRAIRTHFRTPMMNRYTHLDRPRAETA